MDRHSLSLRPLLLLAMLFAVFFLFNPQVIADWRVYSFDDGTYSHAYLVPFVIGFFYWRAWRQRQLGLRWSGLFFLLFISSLLAFLWLTVAQQLFFYRLALPLVLVFALASVFRVNASLWVPVSLLWFITPVWGVINGYLQWLSVAAVNWIMGFTRVPTYVEGNFVHIPSGVFEIAGGCSGLRYVIVAVFLTIAFCFLNLQRKRSMALFAILALLGALVTNWIRIALLIYIGNYTEMQSELIADHNMFGWYIFIPFIVVLFYVGTRLERAAPPLPAALPAATGRPGIPAAIVLLSMVVMSGVGVNYYQTGNLRWLAPTFDVEAAVAGTHALEQPTPLVYVWTRREVLQQPTVVGPVLVQRYFFTGETDGHKADFYLNSPVPWGWRVADTTHRERYTILTVEAPQGRPAILLYWYQVGERRSGNSRRFSFYRLLEALRLNQTTALHWYFAWCGPSGCQEELEALMSVNE